MTHPFCFMLSLLVANALASPLLVAGTAQPTAANFVAVATAEKEMGEGSSTLDMATLRAARAEFASCAGLQPAEVASRCSYDLARTEHYLHLAAQHAGTARAAKTWLNSALADAQLAVSRNPDSADAHALLGDIYGEKIDSMFSGMKYGPRANAETAASLRLDPHCAQAWAVLGRKYLFAPALFGGDIDKAIDAFRKATLYAPHSAEDFVWLAIALQKKGKLPQAREAVATALRLDGRSVPARQEEAALR